MERPVAVAALLLGIGVSITPAVGGMGGGMGGGFGGCPGCSGSQSVGGSTGTGGMGSYAAPDNYGMALRALHHEDYDDAITYLKSAFTSRPQSADIMNYLGYSYRMLGDYPTALSWIEKALAQDPDHKKAHDDLGELDLARNDPVSAQGQLAELVRLCPDSCNERDALTKAIADYQAAHPAPPSAAAAPQTPAGAPAATPAGSR